MLIFFFSKKPNSSSSSSSFLLLPFTLLLSTCSSLAQNLECRLTLGPKAGVRVMATARKEGEERKAEDKPSLAKKLSSGLFGSSKALPAAA